MIYKFLLFIICFIILNISCTKKGDDPIPEPPCNEICDYDFIETYIVIDSILPVDENYFYIYYSAFSKSDDEKLLIENLNISNRWQSSADANCISADFLLTGDTLSCVLYTIYSGTCSPVILRILDYEECFYSAVNEYWGYYDLEFSTNISTAAVKRNFDGRISLSECANF